MPYSDINPLEWSTVQPHVDALLATELSRDNAESWLQRWSDLTAILSETRSQINRDVSENTADEEAEKYDIGRRRGEFRQSLHHQAPRLAPLENRGHLTTTERPTHQRWWKQMWLR